MSDSTPDPGPEGHAPAEPEYDWSGYAFDTRQVHAGEAPEPAFGARIAPIYLTAGYRFDSFDQAAGRFSGDDEGQLYSRNANPTVEVAERRVANLEGGVGAVLVASGQAATTHALLALAGAGERIAATSSLFSGTRALFGRTFARLGVSVDYVDDPTDAEAWQRAIHPTTKAIFTETIPNPLGDLNDIQALAALADSHGLPLVVDNTVASPYLHRPLEHGAHIVVHSGTKFLTGHGAALSGLIVDGGRFDWAGAERDYAPITAAPVPGRPSFAEAFGPRAYEAALRFGIINDTGPTPSPLHAFLLQQGTETLSLRMRQHLASAHRIAAWLDEQPRVHAVHYAGLPAHPQHALAVRDFAGTPGSVFAFTLHGGIPEARAFYNALRVFSRMTHIGDTRSMALHPATTTHGGYAPEQRAALGVGDGMIRLSIGLEDPADLIGDLERALTAIG